jgi:uridine phosphorylase
MPARLRPTADIAAAAILVGDPGRALALAQTLLVAPKMSNHARGLWGYSGTTHAGAELTLQATGIGGPSAALVLADLAELGVRRAIRVGTATGLGPAARAGELMIVREARGGANGVAPDAELSAALVAALRGGGHEGTVASFDFLVAPDTDLATGADAADMQTAALLTAGPRLGVAIAAVLIVAADRNGYLDDEALIAAAERAGSAAAAALGPSKGRP